MRMFHVAQAHIHRDISRDSDVQPMLKNLVVPSSNYDGSNVVLFLDETSQNLLFISGLFSLIIRNSLLSPVEDMLTSALEIFEDDANMHV